MEMRRPRMRMVPVSPSGDEVKVVNLSECPTSDRGRVMVAYEIDNYTGHVIKTIDHMGLCIVHQPTTTTPQHPSFINKLVIKKRLSVTAATQVTSVKVPTSPIESTSDARVTTDILVTDINKTKGSNANILTRTAGIALSFNYATIEEQGCVYLREFDLLVCTANAATDVLHPNSEEYIEHRIAQLYDGAHTYSVEINETVKTNNMYYVNIAGTVHTISPTNHTGVGDIFKVSFKSPTGNNSVIATGLLTETDKLELVGIFNNYADADNYGKKMDILKDELARDTAMLKAEADRQNARYTLELNKAKQELELAKQELDEQGSVNKLAELTKKFEAIQAEKDAALAKSMIDQDRMIRELENEREKFDRDRRALKDKDYYEERSYSRKDTSETFKFIPVLLGGALALFSIYNK